MTGRDGGSLASLLLLALLLMTHHHVTPAAASGYSLRFRREEDLRCGDEITTAACNCDMCTAHNSTWLEDKCCVYQGIPASLLAFEREDRWIPRLKEFNACTGARVQLSYNGEDGQGDEDTMEEDLRQDVGVTYRLPGGTFTEAGAGIYDAYIVQAPWLPAIVDGLENLSPWISENAAEILWTDVNPATREAVSFNGTVRALPLDTDYIALGYRQDVYDEHGLQPPETVEELVEHSELLNGRDHNGDGQGDWGYCLTPQVNYLYAFVAPVLQQAARECDDSGACDGDFTEQNLFFNATTFEPFLDHPGFRYAVRLFSRLVRSSNCQDQETCDRMTAFPTGRCAGVLSMPSTMTQLLLPDGKYTINTEINGKPWQPNTINGYWGRRISFPGSDKVYNQRSGQVERCTRELCPKAVLSRKTQGKLINYTPFFAEGGESYAIRNATVSSKKRIMRDFFGWLASLPVTRLPLSGQYRRSHLNENQKQLLLDDGWPQVMADDLFDVLSFYFDENANQAQDLLILGFSEYYSALDKEVFANFLLSTDFFNLSDDAWEAAFDERFDKFTAATRVKYDAITGRYGRIQQLERWRASLSLPPLSVEDICQNAEVEEEADCVALASQQSKDGNEWAVALVIVLAVVFVLAAVVTVLCRRHFSEAARRKIFEQEIKRAQQKVHDEMVQRFGYDKGLSSRYEALKVQLSQVTLGHEIGRGAFGVVLLSSLERNGEVQQVAVKRLNTDVDSEEQDTFLYECRLLAMLDHPHIIKIIGVQVDVRPVLLITEYMELGSLVYVLRDTTSSAVSEDKLYNILSRVADACVYLASHNIVHRDIAARNVLVGKTLDEVRLSDFGMSRLLANTDYYRKKSDDMVPIKWMPLEAIEKKLFSSASDVWAWGVLAWEVMTLGTTPWASHTAVETALAIAKGERLPKPALATDELYKLLLRCWKADPDDRPTFRRILRFFRGKCSALPQTSALDTLESDMPFSTFAMELESRKREGEEPYPVSRPGYTSLSHVNSQASRLVSPQPNGTLSNGSAGSVTFQAIGSKNSAMSSIRNSGGATPLFREATAAVSSTAPAVLGNKNLNGIGVNPPPSSVMPDDAPRSPGEQQQQERPSIISSAGYHSISMADIKRARKEEAMRRQLARQPHPQQHLQKRQDSGHTGHPGGTSSDRTSVTDSKTALVSQSIV